MPDVSVWWRSYSGWLCPRHVYQTSMKWESWQWLIRFLLVDVSMWWNCLPCECRQIMDVCHFYNLVTPSFFDPRGSLSEQGVLGVCDESCSERADGKEFVTLKKGWRIWSRLSVMSGNLNLPISSTVPPSFLRLSSRSSLRKASDGDVMLRNEGRWPTSIAPTNPCRPEIRGSSQWMVAKVL